MDPAEHPAGGFVPHVNIFENNGRFEIDLIMSFKVPELAKALENVIKEHALPVQSSPERSFILLYSDWHDGM
jgi:hypothetical protein